MGTQVEEDRWVKLREIVRQEVKEEGERIAERILAVIEKHSKTKLGFKDGRWTGVTEEQMGAWRAAYGMVDVDAELKRAAAWIVSNPHLAPKTQLGRFLNTWFAKTQDRAAIRSIPAREERPVRKRACGYCSNDATGVANMIPHCRLHVHDAMDEKPRKMLGVVPAPVAGND